MKIAVIGGAGYIGSHCVLALKDAGHDVVVMDNLERGDTRNIDATAVLCYTGDIRSREDCEQFFKQHQVDAVILTAALKAVGESMEKPGLYIDNNINGSINVVNAMLAAGVKTLVYSSSAAVYGEPERVPVREDDPTIPTSVYGFTKLECERILDWYQQTTDLKVANLRYFNVVGYDPQGRLTTREPQAMNLLPIIFEALIEEREQVEIFGTDYDTPDGTCIRDYIHVSDLAHAHVKALEKLQDVGELHRQSGHRRRVFCV